MSPKIKICGVCDPLEARRIEELGADYVGMIFYSRSPRFVDIGKVKAANGVNKDYAEAEVAQNRHQHCGFAGDKDECGPAKA